MFRIALTLSFQLYTHIPIMKKILRQLEDWNYKLCGVFILDAHFVDFPSKFISGTLYCLSAMMQMELAQVTMWAMVLLLLLLLLLSLLLLSLLLLLLLLCVLTCS